MPAFVWAVVVLAVSSIPAWHLRAPAIPHLDKVAHFGEYLVLAALAVWGLMRPGAGGPRPRAASICVPVIVMVAALDELHQRWIPGRSCDVFDLAFDAAGVLAGAAAMALALRAWKRRRG